MEDSPRRRPNDRRGSGPVVCDLAIADALVFDGRGTPPVRAAVGLKGGRIAAVEPLKSLRPRRIIRFPGKYLAPGFIDIHTHSDFSILSHPLAESKILQGVTTEVIGNCGSSASPLLGEKLSRERSRRPELKIDWRSLKGYRRRVARRGTAVNLVPLTGQGNLRAGVMGYAARPPGRVELGKMIGLLERELEAGSRGFSTGLIYPPGIFSAPAELAELLRRLGGGAGIYATHLRSESSGLIQAVGEAIGLAEETGVSLLISHLKAQGRRNWKLLGPALALIAAARRRGVPVHCDRYPYSASCTDLDVLLPAWAQEGGEEEQLRRLSDRRDRARIRREITWTDWNAVMIARLGAGGRSPREGRRLGDLAREAGIDPTDCLIRILKTSRLKAEAVFFSLSEANLIKVLRRSFCVVGSDSASRPLAESSNQGFPHPRGMGTFPRFLSLYRRRCGLSWTKAIHRATSLPAELLGLDDRGVIRPGAAADLAVIDPARLADRADYRQPWKPPQGVEMVMVNGEIVAESGRVTGKLPGRIL